MELNAKTESPRATHSHTHTHTHTHTQCESAATRPTLRRSVSPLGKSLNAAAMEVATAADYRCCSWRNETKVAAAGQVQGQCSQKDSFSVHLAAHEKAPPTLSWARGSETTSSKGPCSQDADYAHASEQNVQSVASHSLTKSMQSWLEFCLPAIHWHWKLALKQCSVILVFNSQHSDQQNAQYSSLNIYITISHWTFLHVSIPKRSSSGNQIKVTPHKTNNPCIK